MRERVKRYGRFAVHQVAHTLAFGIVLGALSVLLLLANALLASVACGQWHFYPALPRLVAWWGYVPYAALVLLPAALELVGRLRWR